MRTPSEFELDRLLHANKMVAKPKVRQPGKSNNGNLSPVVSKPPPPVKTRDQTVKELGQAIVKLETQLAKLEVLTKKRETTEASVDRKSVARKERAAKENSKPASVAEKANVARANAKLNGGSGKDASSNKKGSEPSVSELKTLATRVKGQLAVAKQKLAAL